MSELILVDRESHLEVGRRSMSPNERFEYYRAFDTHTLVTFAHRRFRIHTVAWRIPEGECVLVVTYDSDAPTNEPFAC